MRAIFIYGLETKRNYLSEVDYHVPPRLPAATLGAIEEAALAVYRVIGAAVMSRASICASMRRAGHASSKYQRLPGLDPVRSDLPILCGRLGIAYPELIDRIVRHAAERWRMSLPQQQPGCEIRDLPFGNAVPGFRCAPRKARITSGGGFHPESCR